MIPIVVDSAELHAHRRKAVRRLVAPLLPNPPNAIVEQLGLGRDAYTLGVVPHGRQPVAYINPEEALVPTRVPRLLMNYYESWKQDGQADSYYLDRAYMHIHLALRQNPRQLLSLHCDPSMRSSEAHFRYKRGPHVHIEGANPSLNRAHISLCISDEQLGGVDLRTMMISFSAAVQMIAAELFPCWERGMRITDEAMG